ncbi:LysR substrate-binding domain-containing protein [Luteimonas sp. RD2P54]|uniref:LysR substrate-binding domain-containing protein n=1 Tax=Luteimonas endophytica TaxID=3042023 RepID=A0ABT6JCQ6_9GAMM|nr:LysR substrate-binding domain-containing protein [Luteimonas endophytica]MDH5824598.1 LysR substrate-binding domain-containing protein [Luteimonas endophytica]
MDRPNLPLNGLRAFEAAARHLNFTRAALELCVTQAALSHRIKGLEARLGFALFRRLPRGVALTDEGAALFPVIGDAFDRIGAALGRFEGGRLLEALTVSAVATFATGWLLPRLGGFALAHPGVDLRLLTHNNRVDQAGEGLDLAIRFGEGAWQGLDAVRLCGAPFAPVCAPALARRIREPRDLAALPLLRSYRPDEWSRWFRAARLPEPTPRGPVFDSSLAIASAAAAGAGVALLPLRMFGAELAAERLVRLFDIEVDVGAYWLTRLRTRPETGAMQAFREWILAQAPAEEE